MTPVKNNPSLKCASGNNRASSPHHRQAAPLLAGGCCAASFTHRCRRRRARGTPGRGPRLRPGAVPFFPGGRTQRDHPADDRQRARKRKRNQLDEANLLLADLYYSYGLYEESRELFAELLNRRGLRLDAGPHLVQPRAPAFRTGLSRSRARPAGAHQRPNCRKISKPNASTC